MNTEATGMKEAGSETVNHAGGNTAPANTSKAQSGRRARWIFILLPVLMVVGYFIYQEYFSGRETTDDAQIDGPINPVAAKVSGQVSSIFIRDNQFVKAGTILIQIDPRDYQVALEKAQADLAAAQSAADAAQTHVPMISTTTSSQTSLADAAFEQVQAARDVALKDVRVEEAKMATTQARVRAAEASHTKAMQDLERMKLLIARDEISRQQYDAAVAAADATRAVLDSVKSEVEEASQAVAAAQARVLQAEARIKEALANQRASRTAPQQMAISRSNVKAALAKVKQAQATLTQAKLSLEYAQVKAPIDGFVSQKRVELGQFVQIGQPLLALVPIHKTWITANFKENQLEEMRPGQKAVISVDAYGGQRFEGHVDSIAAATGARFSLLPPENATGNYVKVVQRIPVKIVIDKDPDDSSPLRPGLSVVATVFVGGKQ
jgi:membrane fusion protein (multidrug efflux system)